jgi:hypothetical protein
MSRWFQKKEEELPEKLRGKSEEDLVKAMEDAEALKASLAAKDTEVATLKTAGETQKTELETIKAKLTELEAGGGTPQRRQSDQSTGPASVFVNEEQAFRDRTAGLHAMTTVSGSLAARLTAREAVQNAKEGRTETRIWDKYANEINTLMSKEVSERQIDPRSWLNAFVYVKGLHMGELMESMSKKTDVFAEVGGSTGGGLDTTGGDDKKDALSPAELEIAKKFKMTPEKYLERKKSMKFISA